MIFNNKKLNFIGTKPAPAQISILHPAASPQNGSREDVPLTTYSWSKPIPIHPNYVTWNTWPKTTIKVMRDGNEGDVTVIQPGEHPSLGDPDSLQFMAVGSATTLTVRRE